MVGRGISVIKLGEMLMILELHRQGFVGVRNRQGDRWRPQDGAQTFNQMNALTGANIAGISLAFGGKTRWRRLL
jgi:hypothetical protein